MGYYIAVPKVTGILAIQELPNSDRTNSAIAIFSNYLSGKSLKTSFGTQRSNRRATAIASGLV